MERPAVLKTIPRNYEKTSSYPHGALVSRNNQPEELSHAIANFSIRMKTALNREISRAFMMFNQFEACTCFPPYLPRVLITTPMETPGTTRKLSGFKTMWKKTTSVFAMIITLLLVSFQSSGIAGTAEIEVTHAIQQELNYLFHFMRLPHQRRQDFVPGNLTALIAFVAEEKSGDRLFYAGKRFRANSAYYEFHITRSLKQVLGYAFNPAIPYSGIAPATVRS